MLDEKDLQELAEFEGKGAPVLSLYLDTDLTRQPKEKYKLVLRELLEEVSGEAVKGDVERVRRFFDFEYAWRGRGVAVFSCQKQGFWRAFPLAVPLPSQAFTGERAHIAPLANLLDEYERYGVVLVDRQGARLFLFRMGVLEEVSGVLGKGLKRHKRGGWAQARYQRHVDQLAQQNLKQAAEATAEFCEEGECHRLILGGTDENVAQFGSMLPKSLQERVVGSLPLGLTASKAEIQRRSLELIAEAERRSERELVEKVITAAAKGGAGAIGLADTLGAVHEGRVRVLAVAESYTAPGYRCQECGYLVAQEIEDCPFCGGKMERVDDAVDLIVRKVVEGGGQVEVVKDSDELARAGSIGALLRY